MRKEYGDVLMYLEIWAVREMYFLNMKSERVSIRRVIVL